MALDRASLVAAIASLEAQRATLGDAVVDVAIAPLRAELADLDDTPHDVGGPDLRPATVCFVDMVGSTALANRLDLEDVHELTDVLLERCTAAVERHGGRVLKYTGDGLLAVFGEGAAAEHGAEDGVRAGLAVLATVAEAKAAREIGPELELRVGIDTGRVLLGGGVEAERSIRGPVVNLAARMEQTAPPGALRISERTQRLVEGLFDVAEEPPIEVKGFPAPVRSSLVERARPRSFRQRNRGLEGAPTTMVGRDRELGLLTEVWDDVAEHGRLRVVGIAGEAGVGKSRLLRQFEDGPLAGGAVLRSRAQPATAFEPYGMVRSLLLERFPLPEGVAAGEAARRFVATIALLVPEPGAAHLIAHLIGFDLADDEHVHLSGVDPDRIRQRAMRAMTELFRALASEHGGRPLAVLLEDLHWADQASLDALDHLVLTLHDVAMLLVATTRPGPAAPPALWSAADGRVTWIELGPLDEQDADALLDDLLVRLDAVPVSLRRAITGGTGGNPYFIEEVVRMLLDTQVIERRLDGTWRVDAEIDDAVSVPPTLEGVLQARLDALSDDERTTIQEAAVVGHVFWDSAVLAIGGSRRDLVTLQRKGLVVERPTSTLAGDREFTFQHHLLHQFTYDSILKPARRRYHAAAAAWSERLGSEASPDFVGTTGEHHLQAGNQAAAIDAFTRAAEAAARRAAGDVALRYVERALPLVPEDDAETRWRLVTTSEQLLAEGDDRGRHDADLDALERLAEQLDDDVLRTEASLRRARAHNLAGDHRAAERTAAEALELADAIDDDSRRGRALSTLAGALRRQGRAEEARAMLERCLLIAERLDEPATRLSILSSMAGVAADVGDRSQVVPLAHQVFALADALHDPAAAAMAWNALAIFHSDRNELDELFAAIAEVRRLSREAGSVYLQVLGQLNEAAGLLVRGDHDRAAVEAQEAADLAALSGSRDLEAISLLTFGLARVDGGDRVAGRAALERSRDLFLQNDGPHYALEPTAALALLDAEDGNRAAALAGLDLVLAASPLPDGLEAPIRIEAQCVQALELLGDERAPAALTAAHETVATLPGWKTDAGARERHLAVTWIRAIDDAWERSLTKG